MTPEGLGRVIGQDKADAVIAYLRANPQALGAPAPATLALAREKLAQSLAAYRAGDRGGAERLALSAYLDGFEPVEPILDRKSVVSGKSVTVLIDLGGLRTFKKKKKN